MKLVYRMVGMMYYGTMLFSYLKEGILGMMNGKRVWILGILVLILLCAPEQVSAKTGWRIEGDASVSGSTCTLTDAEASSFGALFYNAPLDTRSGFNLSFQYWVGDRTDNAREGFMLIFGNSPLSVGGYGSDLGYDDYIFGKSSFYGIEFDTYSNSGGDISGEHIAIVKNIGRSRTHLDYANQRISDGTWHDVTITYARGILRIMQDEQIVLTSIKFTPPSMSYFGFSASTFLYAFGYQKHMIRNIQFYINEASHILLNANGGNCPVSSLYALKDTAVQLPTPSRYGYLFDGWYTEASGGTRISGSYPFDGEKTLYAHWKNNMYTITFQAGKGSVSPSSKNIVKKAAVGSLPTPVRKKYTFEGWYTKKKGGKKITSASVPTGNVTYYAHWVSNNKKIRLKLNAEKGSCSKSVFTVKYGGRLKGLPKASRSGYRFLGWYTKKSGGIKVSSSTKTIAILPKKTLYAHWERNISGSGGSDENDSDGGRRKPSLPCTACKGSGKCKTCGGTGYLYSSASKKFDRNCYRCNASGVCQTCKGSGTR